MQTDTRPGVYDIDVDTLRFLADNLREHADNLRAWEEECGPRKMRHASSALLRVWADRFDTDANKLEDE